MFLIKSKTINASKFLRMHAFLKLAALLFSLAILPSAQAGVIGVVDGVSSDASYPYLLRGWTCSTGQTPSLDVQMYANGPVGTGTLVGVFKAESASEPAVAASCLTSGTSYRYNIPLTTAIRKQYAGQAIYVYGVAAGQSNALLNSSGTYAMPGLATVSVTRSYVYDDKQRLCKSIEPETRATLYDYDGAGNVIWSASGQELMSNVCDRASVPASEKTVYVYDAMNRVTSVTYPDGINNTTNTYEADGKLKTVVSNGSTWSFEYNKRRLLTKETLNFYSNYSNTYGYSANGHVASISSPNSTVIDYAPNALGQPTQAGGFATGVQYHPNGSMKQFTYGNGIVYTMTQNARQLPDITSYKLGTTKIAEFDLNFDPNGNVLNNLDLAQAGRTDRSMAYDGLDRLTQVYAPNMWGMANYQYDALDNLRRSTLGLAGFNYYYDANNRVQRIDRDASGNYAYTFDTRGNVLSDGRNNYSFTRANRLAGVTGKETYQYDGFGRRFVSWRQDGTAVVPVYGQDGVLRYDADNKKGGGTTHVQLNGSQIAEHFQKWADGATTITYTLTDALGSPVATTGTTGNVIDRTEYAPFGAPFNRPVDGVGYTGHVMDQATGLVYAQQRYYDPMLGRFLSADPVSANPSTGYNFNRYWYGNNNPYKFTDPDGRISRKELEEQKERARRQSSSSSAKYHEKAQIPAKSLPTVANKQAPTQSTSRTGFSSSGLLVGKPSVSATGIAAYGAGVQVTKGIYNSDSSVGIVTPALGLSAAVDVKVIGITYKGSDASVAPAEVKAGINLEGHAIVGGRFSATYTPPSTFDVSLDAGAGLGASFHLFEVNANIKED
jgi:RHS repeat-associated protein